MTNKNQLSSESASKLSRIATAALLLLFAGSFLAGCGKSEPARSPIVSGRIIGMRVYNKPVGSPGDISWSTISEKDGCRVGVFDSFVVVTKPEGDKIVVPHGWYSGLHFK